jgi:3',5'-cyclic AMP phosphodiesterase CpdA
MAAMFLSTAAALEPASAPASRPAGASTRSAFEPFVMVLTGDPELGSPDLPGTARRLMLLVERANALKAELLVIPGDLLHDPDRPAQVQALDAALKALKVPVLAVAGNHDDQAMIAKRFGGPYHADWFRGCLFLCLNSELAGEAHKQQMAWLTGQLKQARLDRPAHLFVVVHKPPVKGDELDRLLNEYGVKTVLAGHVHTTFRRQQGGYMLHVVSGTAKVRDKLGLRYSVFKVQADRVEQESVLLEPATRP